MYRVIGVGKRNNVGVWKWSPQPLEANCSSRAELLTLKRFLHFQKNMHLKHTLVQISAKNRFLMTAKNVLMCPGLHAPTLAPFQFTTDNDFATR